MKTRTFIVGIVAGTLTLGGIIVVWRTGACWSDAEQDSCRAVMKFFGLVLKLLGALS